MVEASRRKIPTRRRTASRAPQPSTLNPQLHLGLPPLKAGFQMKI